MVRWLSILILTVAALGCTKAIPQFDLLVSEGIPRPLFGGLTTKNQTVSDPSAVIPVSGTCDPTHIDVAFKFSTSSVWGTASALADGGTATVDCAGTGTFSFNLPSLVTMGHSPGTSVTVTLEARGVTSGAVSNSSFLNLVYTVPAASDPRTFRITQGSGTASSSSFKVNASVGFRGPAKASSSSFEAIYQTR